ncbi:MAG: universal stress protein [Chitinophagales bacterium]|nr:universal stress protein [Chitinophagales bacterium]MCZ2392569.1 universal stress protein [Chitinophagales bacterium]
MSEILVPFDHSENAFVALQQALLIAQKSGCSVEVLHVLNILVSRDYPIAWTADDEEAIKESLETKIDAARKILGISEDVSTTVVLQKGERIVDEVLIRAAESNVVLIVMGTHGVTGLVDRLMGTNTLDVISASTWPVLVIPSHWKPVELNHLILAIELKDIFSVIEPIKDLQAFFKLPIRAVEFQVIEDGDIKNRVIEGIPFESVSSNIELSLSENIRNYTQDYNDSILVMFTHPRKLLQRIFSISLTENAAKLITIPLLSIRKDTQG